VLYRRARQCERERKHRVNVVQVDFFQTGDLVRVVDSLNLAGGALRPKKSVAGR
jgi:hypothetical protein